MEELILLYLLGMVTSLLMSIVFNRLHFYKSNSFIGVQPLNVIIVFMLISWSGVLITAIIGVYSVLCYKGSNSKPTSNLLIKYMTARDKQKE